MLKFFPSGALLLLGIVFLAACDDASTVGADLIDSTGEPELEVLSPDLFASVPLRDITGGSARMLTGRVEDPLLGTITATSFFDLAAPGTARPDTTILDVSLLLVPDYVYGDTLTPVTLALFDVTEEWSDLGARADTTFPTAPSPITAFTFAPTDTLVTVPLPESWIAANDTTLRSTSFGTSFHGFALRPEGASAVVGLRSGASSLRIITPTDTLSYTIPKTLSSIARDGEPMLPPNYVLMQDGTGPTLRFNFDYQTLTETPLNGATLRIFADTLALADPPSNFARPVLTQFNLVSVDRNETDDPDDDTSLLLSGEVTLSEEGALEFRSETLRQLMQRTFFGEDLFDYFELRPIFAENTINPIVFYDTTSVDQAPQALLTISPAD